MTDFRPQALLRHWLSTDAHGKLGHLLHPSRRALLLSNRRAATLIQRTRTAAWLLAALTLAFTALDAAVFPHELFVGLALARVCAGGALLLLAVGLRYAKRLSGAHGGLLLLFAIPTVFLFACDHLLARQPLVGAAATVGGIYTLMPFVMAAAISVFPLAWFEALALGLMALGVEAGAMAMQNHFTVALSGAGVLWAVLLVTLMAMVAGMNQVALMGAIIAQATRDPLTGGYLRRTGEEFLSLYMGLARRHGQPLSVLFIDLDRFKAINDDFGHDAGDAVLAQAGAAFKAALRGSDLLVRWGGEEFLIVLPDTDTLQAIAFVERLMGTGLGQRPDGAPLTASLGLACHPHDAVEDWPALVHLADQRMYQAKQAGRNRYIGPPPRTSPGSPSDLPPGAPPPPAGNGQAPHAAGAGDRGLQGRMVGVIGE